MFGWFVGIGLASVSADDQAMGAGPYPALEAAATYRPSDGFGVGLRARASRVDEENLDSESCPGHNATSLASDQRASIHTFDLGATAEVVRGRWLIAPWLGAHLASGHSTTTFYEMDPTCPPAPSTIHESVTPPVLFTGGLLVSLDVWSPDRRDRLAIFVDAQLSFPRAYDNRYATSSGWEPGTSYNALTFGIAYRR